MQRILLLISVLFCSYATFANENFGFIDGAAIMNKYESSIEEKLKTEFKSKEDELNKLQAALVAESETYAKDSAMMSDAEKLKFQQDFERQQMELQKLGHEFSQARMKRGNEEIEKLLKQVEEASKTVAKNKQYNVIFQKGAAIYVDSALDVTDEVLKEMNKK